MSCLSLVAILTLLMVITAGQFLPEALIPANYILDVSQQCGEFGQETTILLKSDLNLMAQIKCRDGQMFNCNTSDGVNHYLKVYFDGDPTQRCVYPDRAGDTHIYCVEIIATFMGKDGESTGVNREIKYLASCTYGLNGHMMSPAKDIAEQFHAPKEIQSHAGDRSDMGVSVYLTDVLGRPLSFTGIPLDKVVCLKVYLDNSSGLLLHPETTSLFPVSCEAVGATTGKRHAFLRAGCGDGIVFKTTEGFSLHPRAAVSPYFKFFNLEHDQEFSIQCNFTVCSDCIGKNSCTGEADGPGHVFKMFRNWIENGGRMRKRSSPNLGVPLITRKYFRLKPLFYTVGSVQYPIAISTGQ